MRFRRGLSTRRSWTARGHIERGVEVALTGRAPSRKIVEKADYITEMRCEKHPYEQGICAREGVEY